MTLYETIKKEAKKRADKMIDAYIAKRFGGDYNTNVDGEIELYKTIMVNVDGNWYRCQSIIHYALYECHDAGDNIIPPSYWEETEFYVTLTKITNEATKEVILRDGYRKVC